MQLLGESRGDDVRIARSTLSELGTEGIRDSFPRYLSSLEPSFERDAVLHAFVHNPTLAWTPYNLSSWYGIRLDVVRAIVGELTEWGIIRWVPGPGDRYLLERTAGSRS